MKTYSKNIEQTLITFHIGLGGQFWKPGHKSYLEQDMTIDSYVNCDGSKVGLNVENDGTGVIDRGYNTEIVKRLEDCSNDELILIHESRNYKSPDVEDYCKNRLLEKGSALGSSLGSAMNKEK